MSGKSRKFHFLIGLTVTIALAPVLADLAAAELARSPVAGELAAQPVVTQEPSAPSAPSAQDVPAPPPNSILVSTGDLHIAIFPAQSDDGEFGLDIYQVGSDGRGSLLFQLSADLLASLPDNLTRNTRIVASADGKIALYKLTTGEYQVNVGPDIPGNVKVVVFSGVPPTRIYYYEFNVYDILEGG